MKQNMQFGLFLLALLAATLIQRVFFPVSAGPT